MIFCFVNEYILMYFILMKIMLRELRFNGLILEVNWGFMKKDIY